MSDSSIVWPHVSRPDEYARLSPRVNEAHRRLLWYLEQISDSKVRDIVGDMLYDLNSQACGMQLVTHPHVRENDPALVERLSERLDYNLWWGAPGASEGSHHGYPGGWIMHTVTNLHSAEVLCDTLKQIRGVEADRESLYAAVLLHDCLKPRLFLWRNGRMDVNQGSSGHHVAVIAEAWLRGLPRSVLVYTAGLHTGWWKNEEAVRGYMEQAGQLVGDAGLIETLDAGPNPVLVPEGWIARQSEEAWYTANRKAIQAIKQPLQEWLASRYTSEEERVARWWQILMIVDELELSRDLAAGKQVFEQRLQEYLRSKTIQGNS